MNNLEKVECDVDEVRGWVLLPVEDEALLKGEVNNIHIASIQPTQIRGNHYHLFKTEYIYIYGGTSEIAIKDVQLNTAIERITIKADTPFLLIAKPKVAHSIMNVGSDNVYLFCYGSKGYDPENSDVVSEILLP